MSNQTAIFMYLTRRMRSKSFLFFCIEFIPPFFAYLQLQFSFASDPNNPYFDLTEKVISSPAFYVKAFIFSSLYCFFYHAIKMRLWQISNTLSLLVSLVIHGFFYACMLCILLYFNYFETIPNICLLFYNIGEATAISGQVFVQLLESKAYIILASFGCSLLLTLASYHTRPLFTFSNKTFLLSLLTIAVVNIVITHIQVRRNPELAEPKIFHLHRGALSYGILPAYTFMIHSQIKSLINPISVPYPGTIRRPQPKLLTTHFDKTPNILVIQVESLESHVIDMRINGKNVMPFLSELKKKSLYFTNFYAQHAGGGSSDAELSSILSVLPIVQHSGMITAGYQHVDSLVEVLEKTGYHSASFHANASNFFGRDYAHTMLGFDRFYSKKDYSIKAQGKTARAGFESFDQPFFAETANKLASLPTPFFGYIITLQSHGPFNNFKQATHQKLGLSLAKHLKPIQKNYIASIHEVDSALGQLFETLYHDPALSNTVLAIFSDHQSAEFATPECPSECIPFMIYHPKLSATTIHTYGSHLDIAPTLMDLLNLSYDQYRWLGTSLLQKYTNEDNKALLYSGQVVFEGANRAAIRDIHPAEQAALDYSYSVLGK